MFNANDYTASNFVGKIFNPGTHVLQMLDIVIDIPSYDTSAMHLEFLLETQPIGGEFEGIDIDKNNPARGKYKGQIGRVKAGQYPFSTYEWQGKTIDRDQQIYNYLMKMADQLNVLDKIKASNVQANEITDYIAKIKPFMIGAWGMFTIAGKEYFKEGYTNANYRLFFPKPEHRAGLFPFSAKRDAEGKVIKLISFDESKHIVPEKKADPQAAQNVTGFSTTGFNPGQPAAAPGTGMGMPAATGMPQAPAAAPQSELFGQNQAAPAPTGSFDPTPAPVAQPQAQFNPQPHAAAQAPAQPSLDQALAQRGNDDDLPF